MIWATGSRTQRRLNPERGRVAGTEAETGVIVMVKGRARAAAVEVIGTGGRITSGSSSSKFQLHEQAGGRSSM